MLFILYLPSVRDLGWVTCKISSFDSKHMCKVWAHVFKKTHARNLPDIIWYDILYRVFRLCYKQDIRLSPSVYIMLVDCDHVVQQTRKQHDWLASWLPAYRSQLGS